MNPIKNPSLEHPVLYIRWSAMNYRCRSKKCGDYAYYGGRGIIVCERWHILNQDGFANFVEDMGASFYDHLKRYGRKNTTIDRIDGEKGYSKENCRWATAEENNKNKRTLDCKVLSNILTA